MPGKSFIHLIAVITFFLASCISNSQSLRAVNFQGAGWVTAVKYTTNGARLYARTDVGGVFRSDNAEWSGDEFCPMRYIDISFTQWQFCSTLDNCWSKISVNDR